MGSLRDPRQHWIRVSFTNNTFHFPKSNMSRIYHPIHLHGHDFWVVGQAVGIFDVATSPLNLINPPRRDVATLPGNGYLAIAFKKDNPGSWLLHCHIAWHASEGLAMQFVESESDISVELTDTAAFMDTCSAWDSYTEVQVYGQDDSGI